MFTKGHCNNISDQTIDAKFEEFFTFQLSKCRSYSEAANDLGITKDYLKVLIHQLNIESISIVGIKEKILLPSQIKAIRQKIGK